MVAEIVDMLAMAICYLSKWPFLTMYKYITCKVNIRVKLDYIRLDSVRLKLLLTRLTTGVYICTCK